MKKINFEIHPHNFISKEETGGFKSLTPAEKQVLKFRASGKTRLETAQILGISEKTVDAHSASIFKKLNIHHETDLGRIWAKLGTDNQDAHNRNNFEHGAFI